MTAQMTTQDILSQIGDPASVAKELQQFRKAAMVLSSRHPRMIDRYKRQWIAVYQGRVKATGRTFQSLMAQVDAKSLPRDRIIVRYIHKDQRTMIL